MKRFDEWVAQVRAVNPDVQIDPALRSRFDDPDGYRERCRVQALSWAMGRPYHNHVDDECAPDFSCCHRDLAEPDPAKRWARYRQQYGRSEGGL